MDDILSVCDCSLSNQYTLGSGDACTLTAIIKSICHAGDTKTLPSCSLASKPHSDIFTP